MGKTQTGSTDILTIPSLIGPEQHDRTTNRMKMSKRLFTHNKLNFKGTVQHSVDQGSKAPGLRAEGLHMGPVRLFP